MESGKLLERLLVLKNLCEDDMKSCIEQLLAHAGRCMAAIYFLRVAEINMGSRALSQQQDEVSAAKARFDAALSAFADDIKIVNRLCRKYEQPAIYDGPQETAGYIGFAEELVQELKAYKK